MILQTALNSISGLGNKKERRQDGKTFAKICWAELSLSIYVCSHKWTIDLKAKVNDGWIGLHANFFLKATAVIFFSEISCKFRIVSNESPHAYSLHSSCLHEDLYLTWPSAASHVEKPWRHQNALRVQFRQPCCLLSYPISPLCSTLSF